MEQGLSKLSKLAIKAREKAYCPYSKFAVGAALITKGGRVYTGCNIECASSGGTNCAERTAIFKAVSEGEREFEAIAIAGGKSGEQVSSFCAPCGICRQIIREFCSDDFKIILTDGKSEKTYTLCELLPVSFGPGNLV